MKRSLNAVSLEPERAAEPAAGASIVVDLFRKHAHRVRRSLTFRLRDPEDAKDATQEVFLKLWRQEREGQLRQEATAYLNSAASSMATDFERWRAVHVADRIGDEEIENVPSGAASAEDTQHWREAMARFVEAVDALPGAARDVFLLHQVKGLTYPQIAKQLAISTRTVERHVAQAIAILDRRLRNYL